MSLTWLSRWGPSRGAQTTITAPTVPAVKENTAVNQMPTTTVTKTRRTRVRRPRRLVARKRRPAAGPQRKKKKQHKPARQMSGGAPITPQEVQCLREYTKALIAPDLVTDLPCNPTIDQGSSIRSKAWARGGFATGASGNGYIVVNARGAFAGNLGIARTDSVYPTFGIDTNAAGVILEPMGSPLPKPDQQKIVGLKLTVWYTGKVLDCAGTIISVRAFDNIPQNVAVAGAGIIGAPSNKIQAITPNQRYMNVWLPLGPGDSGYFPPLATSFPAPNWHLGFFIYGASGNQNFGYEITAFYENLYLQTNANFGYMATATPSLEFPTNATRINSAAYQAYANTTTFTEEDMTSSMGASISNAVPAVATSVGIAMASAAGRWAYSRIGSYGGPDPYDARGMAYRVAHAA